MNPRIKELWLAALRSGEYKQGLRCLTQINDNGDKLYCCLGVLCDLAAKELPDLVIEETDVKVTTNRKPVKGLRYNEEVVLLPAKVQEWANLSSHCPSVYSASGKEKLLTDVNDLLKYNFNKIANLIEKYL